jgi:lipopolysaccharide transport system ATP-binding protein
MEAVVPSRVAAVSADSGPTLVRVEGASKKFCRSLKRSLWYGLQDIVAELNPRRGEGTTAAGPNPRLRPMEFWAVDDVSFTLRRGECLGLIGRNGAGKTTLLKMLNGLIRPDHGRIEMRGRVGALIALGAGFNPILTGRENIYVNSSVLGLGKREIDAKIEEIIDFADIGDFIDAPVQSYSSGMQVRLGFAVATALDPDVLILDEVLAVGDAAFRAKCYSRIGKLRERAAVIFVSHSMEHVTRICSSAMCLDGGRVLHYGDVAEAVRVYSELNTPDSGEDRGFLSLESDLQSATVRFEPQALRSGETTTIEVRCVGKRRIAPSRLNVIFYAEDGSMIAEYDSREPLQPERSGDRVCTFRRTLGPIDLLQGRYRIGVNLIEGRNGLMLLWSFKQHALEVQGHVSGIAHYQVNGRAPLGG